MKNLIIEKNTKKMWYIDGKIWMKQFNNNAKKKYKNQIIK